MRLGIFFCFLSVLLGAFGAHALKESLTPEFLAIWHTATTYQFFHGLALILLTLWMNQKGLTRHFSVPLFAAGIFIFSGSLYLLCLTGNKNWGMFTPLGGLFLMAGWVYWFFKSKFNVLN